MANAVTVQRLTDGPRNHDIKVDIFADSADFASTIIIDPTGVAFPFAQYTGEQATMNNVGIEEIEYSVADGWFVTLFWDATTPVRILDLNGRGRFPLLDRDGAIQNNAGAGKTGKVTFTTTGWPAGLVKTASLVIRSVKQL